MFKFISNWIIKKVTNWLTKQGKPFHNHLCDFETISNKVKKADILLIEGRSRASQVIKQVTQSPWSHAALYIGRLKDIEDNQIRKNIKLTLNCSNNTQLLIESEIGLGTIISPISKYKDDHIRIIRANILTAADAKKVIKFALTRLGGKYNVRQLLDLMRFLFPWGLFPRRWRSALFQHNALQLTEDICSSMIAHAFQSVNYPILPLVIKDKNKNLIFVKRNPKLFTPSDFDYSPYFSVIKYPILNLTKKGAYTDLPWKELAISNDEGSTIIWLKNPKFSGKSAAIKEFLSSEAFAVIGASSNKNKFGYKVLSCYLQNGLKVTPVNPFEKSIQGINCLSKISELPTNIKSISIVTPPNITKNIVSDAITHGISSIWMQPGAEDDSAITECINNDINVIAKGPCILNELNYREEHDY